jgi:hypothetical protein
MSGDKRRVHFDQGLISVQIQPLVANVGERSVELLPFFCTLIAVKLPQAGLFKSLYVSVPNYRILFTTI